MRDWRRTTAVLCCLLTVLAACSRGDDEGRRAAPADSTETEASEPAAAPTEQERPDAPTAAATTPPAGGDVAAEGPDPADEEEPAPEQDEELLLEGSFGGDPVASDDFPASGGAVAQLTDVSVGTSEDGYDRVVLEFAGDEMPSYRVSLVDAPVDGSGGQVEIDGSSFLEIRVTPAGSGSGGGPERLEGDTSTITEVVRTGDADGQLTWLVGLRQDMPFAVSERSDPLRLVVDVDLL